MNRAAIALTLLCLGAGTYMIASGSDKTTKVGGPHYYSSFKTKSLPEIPTGSITEIEAKQNALASSYYVAFFNNAGKLVKFEKYFQGKLDWFSEYTYYPETKLLRGRNVSQDGSETVYQFDAAGKVKNMEQTTQKKS